MKKILVVLLTLVMVFCFAACGNNQDEPEGPTAENPVVWKVGTSAGLVNGHHVIYDFILEIAENVKEATGGRYIIEPYHSSQLGSDRDTLEGTVMGTYQMTVVPGTFCAAYVDEFNVFEFPYLFQSGEHFFGTMQSDIAKEIGDKLEDAAGLKWLGNGLNGCICLTNSIRPVRNIEDFAGIKIRVIDSPIEVGAINLLGGNGTVVNWGETYTALQQNTIDGCATTGSGYLSANIQEVQKYFTETNMFYTPITVVMNLEYWNTLPAEDQALIQEAVSKAIQWDAENGLTMLNNDAQAAIEKGGLEFVSYDEFDHEAAKAAVAPLYDEYAKFQSYFDRIAELAK